MLSQLQVKWLWSPSTAGIIYPTVQRWMLNV